MSSIPEAAMPHAKAHHDDKPAPTTKADDKAGGIIATVKAHPVAAAAVGATVVMGVAAAAVPLLKDGKSAGKRKTGTKKPAEKKPAPKKSAD